MARGKYATKAAVRKAELEVTSDLASYQHRVAKLTAENRELRETLDAERRANAQTQKRLRAERDEGVAPQVQALHMQLEGERRRHHDQINRIFDAAATVVRGPNVALVQSNVVKLAEAMGRTWAELAGPAAGIARRTRRTPSRVGNANIAALEIGYAQGLARATDAETSATS